jgi:prolipoprotein diacylglyceryltransferase
MYPDFQYLLQGIFGTAMPEWLAIFKTFGLMVATAFIAAAYVLVSELKRKEKMGLLSPTLNTYEVGRPATANELLLSALLGFVLGYKIGGLFGHWATITPNPMGYLFSAQGNVIAGILGALIIAYARYADKKKQQLPEPQMKKELLYPHQRITEIVVMAAFGGLVGAKVFNAFESWDDFIRDPAGSLLSSSGLTFYGGLIVATAILYYYSRKHKFSFRHFCDAAAPALMLAYGIGRFGCQFAGDGDWGIFNSAYVTQPDGSLKVATMPEFRERLNQDSLYFVHNFGSIEQVPYGHAVAPNWLPRWLFAMNYPHNVNNDGLPLPGCTGAYCAVLPVGVFPTPLYEAFTCIALFFLIWAVRRKFKYPLHLFGFYLILNGIERFLVETIRVNYKYDLGFIHPTQAEIISSLLVITGLSILLFYKPKKDKFPEEVPA